MSQKRSISLCMITKNEEAYIDQCIRSVKGLVTEIILVDTGSTDRTVEIARSLGAKVYFREWDNNFAAPRNLSLARASGNWILVLDADEAIDSGDHKKLRELAKDRTCCYALTQRHYIQEAHISNFKPCRGEQPRWERDAAGYFDSDCVRFFPNGHGIEFRGVVHELVEPSIAEMKRHKVITPQILIHHYGHLKKGKEAKQKWGLYTALGQKKNEIDPTNWKAHFEMAVQYQVNREFEPAIDEFRKCLAFAPRHVPAWVNLGYVLGETGHLADAAEALEKALTIDPNDGEGWCNLGVVHMRLRDYPQAARCLFKAIELNRDHVNAWTNLGETMMCLGNLAQSLQSYRIVLQLTPKYPKACEGAAASLIMMGRYQEAKTFLQTALADNPGVARYHYLLGQACRMTNEAKEAIRHLEEYCSLEAQSGNADQAGIEASRRDCEALRISLSNQV